MGALFSTLPRPARRELRPWRVRGHRSEVCDARHGGAREMPPIGAALRFRAMAAAFVAVVCLLAGSTSADADDRGPSLDAALFAKIDTFLASQRQASDIPGLAVVIVSGDRIVHTAAMGAADGAGRPVTPDTPFTLASVSKAFTATAVMQLVEARRLDLDAPVQRYVPWFRVADEAASGRITLAQLLHHTSGLATSWSVDGSQDPGALERRVRELASEQLLFEPGTGYHYTNAGYDTLGFVVQSVSGVPFDRYVEEHIFEPLGMAHSHVLAADANADGASEDFFRWFGVAMLPSRVSHPRAEGPAGMMYSSANDMGRWIIANLNDGQVDEARVISSAGMEMLHAPAVETYPNNAYAMGWNVRPYWEGPDVLGSAPTRYVLPAVIEHYGDAGTAHAYVGLVPDRGWGIAVLMNTYDWTNGAPYWSVEQGVMRLLAGREPLPVDPARDPISRNARTILIGLLVLELVSLAWSIRMLRRVRRSAQPGPMVRRALLTLTAPLLLDAFVLWLLLIYVPTTFDASLPVILSYEPDTPWIVLPLLFFAGIWATVRTIALCALYLRDRPRRPSASASTPSRDHQGESIARGQEAVPSIEARHVRPATPWRGGGS
jgi:CubicO group peptidase (beta-lactamase class C family)